MLKFLLHTCCAPCSIVVIDELKRSLPVLGGVLTVFFYNPNIHPEDEYIKRKEEVERVCKEWGVNMVDADYDVGAWEKETNKLEKEPEGGRRCLECIKLRLLKTVEYAVKNGFDVFSTTLTSGRNKKADVIHPLAENLADKYGILFFDEDWKAGGRQEKAIKMTEERAIYRQNYCGCRCSNYKSKI